MKKFLPSLFLTVFCPMAVMAQSTEVDLSLTSITPAEGSTYETMPNISATFNNPEAVGYVWYDIIDLNEPDPDYSNIMCGELKKQNDGSWITKYLAMYEIALYEGHIYQLKLSCYDVEDNHNYGLDPLAVLNTEFYGATQGYDYADAELVDLNPWEYSVITNGEIVATFSAPVETLSASVNEGLFGETECTAVASEDHLVWTITIPETVINASTGSLTLNVYAKDAEGKVVKGNTSEGDESYFLWSYNCYNGCPEFSVSPASGSVVPCLDVITASYAGGINFSYSTWDDITVMKGEELVCTIPQDQVTFNETFTEANITIAEEPICENGTYQIIFPVMYFMLGEEFSSTVSKQQVVEYTVEYTPTQLNAISTQEKASVIYNLAGQRVVSDAHGLLVVDGKLQMK